MRSKAGATGGRSNRLRTLSGELSKTQVYNKTTAKARAKAKGGKNIGAEGPKKSSPRNSAKATKKMVKRGR